MDTLFTGKILTHVDVVSSTNELAAETLKNSRVIEGAAFTAGFQTNGRGQRGRVWDSLPNQNIIVSYVYFPVFLKADEQFSLIKAVSLGVKDLLDKYLIDKAKIKWPNDIYINNLKIAGVLIESTMKGNSMGSSIVGVGINVNQKGFENKFNATSVVLETGKGCNINMLFGELSYHIEKRYLRLKGKHTSLDDDYASALYRLNVSSNFMIDAEKKELTIVGVDKLGQLMLRNSNGEINSYGMHQVKMII